MRLSARSIAAAIAIIAGVALVVWLRTDVGGAFLRGSVGSSAAFWSATIVRAIPLTLIGVGIAIAFRGGQLNIGGEGQFLAGAVLATVVGLDSRMHAALAVPLALVVGAAAGGGWAAIAAFLKARFGVLEVISTIMLNFVAANLVSYLVRGPLQEATHVYPQTESIAVSMRLPILTGRLHVGLFVAIAVCVGASVYIRRTAAGFRLRAVGASATAAHVTGRINVVRVGAAALIASGMLAGLAGAIEVTGVTYALYENLSPGYGFSAIAVAIVARLEPLAVLPAAIFFATLETGALGMQRDAGVPATLAMVFEAVIMLAALSLDRGSFARSLIWRRRAPITESAA